jgi:hypothetical protein
MKVQYSQTISGAGLTGLFNIDQSALEALLCISSPPDTIHKQ